MSRLAAAADFHGGPLYTDYRRYPFFAERAVVIRQRFPNAATILVAGCAKGYLVDELRKLGTTAWGCDPSAWARGEAAQAIAANAQFVLNGDCTVASSMATVRSTALGGPAGRRFALCVTEDLLPALSDAEVTSALAALRAIATTLFHIVTPGDPSDPRRVDKALNWKPLASWKALVGTDLVMSTETLEVR